MQSLASVVWFLFQFHNLITAQPYFYSDHQCDSLSNFTIGSNYQKNLNFSLASLARNGPHTGYFTTIIGNASDTVYGQIQCRGYTSAPDCQTCADFVSNEIVQLCPNGKTAWIYNEDCLLRYSNDRFFGITDYDERMHLCNTQKAENPDLFNNQAENLLRDLSYNVAADLSRLASGVTDYTSFVHIYAMAQCTPDIEEDDCFNCLHGLIGSTLYCKDRLGSNLFSLSCNLRYETYLFFKFSSPPSSPPARKGSAHNNGRILKIVGILLASITVALILMCIVWRTTKRKRNGDSRFQTVYMSIRRQIQIEL